MFNYQKFNRPASIKFAEKRKIFSLTAVKLLVIFLLLTGLLELSRPFTFVGVYYKEYTQSGVAWERIREASVLVNKA